MPIKLMQNETSMTSCDRLGWQSGIWTYTPKSELTAKLLGGMTSDPEERTIQQTDGWNPGVLLYKPVLQVRVEDNAGIELEVRLSTRPSPLSSVGLETSAESGDKSAFWSFIILMSTCYKRRKINDFKQNFQHIQPEDKKQEGSQAHS